MFQVAGCRCPAMWYLLVLLACLRGASGRVHRYGYDLLPGVLTGTPQSTAQLGSQMMCASSCSKKHYIYCTGYSYAPNGTCAHYETPCWNTEPREQHPGVVSYERPTSHVWSCQHGGLVLNDTCYFRRSSSTPLTWDAAKVACAELGACARLAQPRDRLTYEFLMRLWRPNDFEWLGAADEDGDGAVTNLDGSQPAWQPPLVSHAAAGPVFLPNGYRRELRRSTPVHNGIRRYVCEAPRDCRLRDPCPEGWLLLHGGCYQLFTDALPWNEAHTHCTRAGPHGRLADISSDIWNVLWEHFFQSSGGRVHLGVKDVEIEGHWVSVYNRSVGAINWMSGQPDNGGRNEDCLEMLGNLANDGNCNIARPFICRCNVNTC